MDRLGEKLGRLSRRKFRIRAKVTGTTERPRLSVSITNQHVAAQIIDDSKSHTLAHATSVGQKELPANLTKRAEWVGEQVAKKAAKAKVKKVVLDRSGKQYHGRVKALAEAARKAGLEF
jgi:large subunit ribosomal protein L18